MAKASQAVILENEFYIIKAPNGKVLEVKKHWRHRRCPKHLQS